MKEFKFSVVMAAYNTELFLAEAIESILAQDIGFGENIQLILVDDGSTDGTGRICDEYGATYPGNIVVVHKENGGAASARNAGLGYASGKYINFMDSDDRLSRNAMGEIWGFYKEHGEAVDLVSIPLEFFDGSAGEHMLNYKYGKGTRVIDLEKEYDMVQLHMASAFVPLEKMGSIRFDSRLTFAEDAKVCLQILMAKRRLGVAAEAKYFYRKRKRGEESTLQQSGKVRTWYLPTLRYFSAESLQMARERCGTIPRFVQFTVMYDLQWKVKQGIRSVEDVLGRQEAERFRDLCFSLLGSIDDEVILEQRNLFLSHKLMLLQEKHHALPGVKLLEDDILIECMGHEMGKLSSCASKWEFLRIERDTLFLEGYAGCLGIQDVNHVEIWIGINDESLVRCEEDRSATGRVNGSEALGRMIFPAITFRFCLKSLSRYTRLSLRLYTKYRGVLVERKNVLKGLFFPVVAIFPHAYAKVAGWLATAPGNRLVLEKSGVCSFLRKEWFLWQDILRSGRRNGAQAILCRAAYWALKPFVPKDIWLISDRINKADDNGEAFFRYMGERGCPEHVYFVLRKDSPDYSRVSRYGKVIGYRSWKHKFLHLWAEKIVSSAADAYVMNPFLSGDSFFWDILKQKCQVFLTHGILMNDLSGWLGRYQKNLGIFVASARPEYRAILDGFGYGPDVVKLTGLPRYDYLEDHRERQITIMPTWRSFLTDNKTYSKDGLKGYGPSFRDSSYFKFYDRLLSHDKLLEAAGTYGYRIAFMPHPNVMPVIHEFHPAGGVEFCSLETRYRDIFAKSSLVVTDYSSAAFDFAYMEKPVLYCQFDRETFFRGHICETGYFDYERDGFGEVETDLDGTVDRIVEYMEKGCRLKEKYRERIQRFFAYHDRENCKRVYEAVLALENGRAETGRGVESAWAAMK